MKYAALHIFIVQVAIVIVLFSFVPCPAAEGVQLLTDLDYVTNDNKTTNKLTGAVSESDFSRTSQLYHLDMGKTLYPNLQFSGGGIYNVDDATSTSAGTEFKTRDTTLRPFAGFLLRNDLYTAGGTYQTTQIENVATGVATRNRYNDLYTGQFNYRPADLPTVIMNYSRYLSHDEPQTYDSVNDRFGLTSGYTYRDLVFDYALTQNDTLQKVTDSEVKAMTQRGGVRYGRQFFDKRLSVNAGSKLNQTSTDFSGSGDNELQINGSQTKLEGDTNPADDTLDTFDPFTTPVDIGKTAPPNRKNSFVLDFGSQADIDSVYVVFKDNDLESGNYALLSQIATLPANSFQWQVYTSTDQLTWVQVLPPSVSFPAFMTLDNDNRFKIILATTVRTQYIKVVATTLPAGASVDGIIEVKGLEAYRRIPGNAGIRHTSTDQTHDLGLQWKFSDRTSAGYDFKLKDQTTDPDSLTKTQTLNGINFRHIFSPIFFGNTRLLRTDTDETLRNGNNKETNYDYSASVRGNYLETFSQTFAYSGNRNEERDGKSSTNSILLRNSTVLYSGWSLNLDLIHSWADPLLGNNTTTNSLRGETNITPHSKVTLSFDYTVSRTDEEGGMPTDRQEGNLQLFMLPLSTLSLSAGHSFQTRKSLAVDTFDSQDYTISWNPFLDGTLQFALSFDESRNSDDDKITSLSPRLTWKIIRNTLFTLSYAKSTSESATETTDSDNYLANVRIFF